MIPYFLENSRRIFTYYVCFICIDYYNNVIVNEHWSSQKHILAYKLFVVFCIRAHSDKFARKNKACYEGIHLLFVEIPIVKNH